MRCINKLITSRSKILQKLLLAAQLLAPFRARATGLADTQELLLNSAQSSAVASGAVECAEPCHPVSSAKPSKGTAAELKSAATRTLSPEEVISAIRETLRSSAADAVVEVIEADQNPLPAGRLEFALNDALIPPASHPEKPFLWRGKVMADNGTRAVMCWARVRVIAKRQVVRVNASYQAGQLLGPDQLSTVEAVICPLLIAKNESVADYAGLCLKRSVHALTQITKEMVEPAPLIRRGDRVQVEAVAGLAHITFDAEAHANGREGQSIGLTNLRSGHAFRGVVIAKGSVLVAVPHH